MMGKIAEMTGRNQKPFDEAPEQTRKMAEKWYFSPGSLKKRKMP